MKYCPITYAIINEDEHYSRAGLKQLSVRLHDLAPLNFSAAEQRAEAIARAGKMSIQGVQVKLSAQLKIIEERFEIVDQYGHYILKPQSEYYPELPENEAISMTLAATMGLNVPLHGLVYSKDNSMTYFVKRFDRKGHHTKIPMEDFSQLSQHTRETKYKSSMEKVADVVEQFCTFPRIEALKLFKLTLFNFLIGNEDMHLKNFSLITQENKVILSPGYDLLNTTIAQQNTKEELALPLNGKKNNLKKQDFLNHFATRLQLNHNTVQSVINQIEQAYPQWIKLISQCYLSKDMKKSYLALLQNRYDKLL